MTKRILLLGVLSIGVLALVGSYVGSSWSDKRAATPYEPRIDPADFSLNVTNKFFRLQAGTKFTYVKSSAGNMERVEIEVTPQTKVVMGVTTRVVRAREWVNDVLKEDTYDWYAQDKAGNVWYFGEKVDNYVGGKVANHDGTWEAGVAGAKPGIIMLAEPKVGDTYRQEYFKGVAEDMGTVISVNEKVVVPYGTFEGCLKIKDWSAIDKFANEEKFYCRQVGFLALDTPAGQPKSRAELVSITRN